MHVKEGDFKHKIDAKHPPWIFRRLVHEIAQYNAVKRKSDSGVGSGSGASGGHVSAAGGGGGNTAVAYCSTKTCPFGELHGADAKEHSTTTDEETDALTKLPTDMEKWTRHDVATWLLHYAGINRDYVKVLHDESKLRGTFSGTLFVISMSFLMKKQLPI